MSFCAKFYTQFCSDSRTCYYTNRNLELNSDTYFADSWDTDSIITYNLSEKLVKSKSLDIINLIKIRNNIKVNIITYPQHKSREQDPNEIQNCKNTSSSHCYHFYQLNRK